LLPYAAQGKTAFRAVGEKFWMDAATQSWVYVATNESFPQLVKIGYTDRDPRTRLTELDSTGVPSPYELAYAVSVDDGGLLEKRVHRSLNQQRHRTSREFFMVTVAAAIVAIREEATRGGIKIYVERDAAKQLEAAKNQQTQKERQRQQEVKLSELNSKLDQIADKQRNALVRHRAWLLQGTWIKETIKVSILKAVAFMAGVPVVVMVLGLTSQVWWPAVIIEVGFLWWACIAFKESRQENIKKSSEYRCIENAIERLDSLLASAKENAKKNVDQPEVLLDAFSIQLGNFVTAAVSGKANAIKVAYFKPVTASTQPKSNIPNPSNHGNIESANTASPPVVKPRKWVKTKAGLMEEGATNLIPFFYLTYTEDGASRGYQVRSREIKLAWIGINDVRDGIEIAMRDKDCPRCQRQYRIEVGLAAVEINCQCGARLCLRGEQFACI
jgi:hypothetical protein